MLLLMVALGGVVVGVGGTVLVYRVPHFAIRRRKAVEDALHSLCDVAGVPLIVMGTFGRVIGATEATTTLGINPHTSKPLASIASDALRTGKPIETDSTLDLHALANGAPFRVRAVPVLGEFVVIIVEDRRASDRLDSVRTDFLVNISHEIKTPVAAIGLLTEALAEAAHDPEAVLRFTQSLSQEVVRLTRMSRDVIELSRIEAGIVDVGRDPFPVADSVREAIEENSNVAASKRITVTLDADDSAVVHADRRMITTALANLVENAIQYSRSGTTVRISVAEEGDMVVVLVADQGVGLRPENIDRVFERFYREDSSRSREGSGLGLSIVKHTASVHQGTVSVSSRLGIGSTFRFELPAVAHQ